MDNLRVFIGKHSGIAWALTLVGFLVSIQVGSALYLTYIANTTNTRGLGWVVLGIWMAASIGGLVVYRRVLHLATRVTLILMCWYVAFLAYGLASGQMLRGVGFWKA